MKNTKNYKKREYKIVKKFVIPIRKKNTKGIFETITTICLILRLYQS